MLPTGIWAVTSATSMLSATTRTCPWVANCACSTLAAAMRLLKGAVDPGTIQVSPRRLQLGLKLVSRRFQNRMFGGKQVQRIAQILYRLLSGKERPLFPIYRGFRDSVLTQETPHAVEFPAVEFPASLFYRKQTLGVDGTHVQHRELSLHRTDVRLDLGNRQMIVRGIDAQQFRAGREDGAVFEFRVTKDNGPAHLSHGLPNPSWLHAPVAEDPRHHIHGRRRHDTHRGHPLFGQDAPGSLSRAERDRHGQRAQAEGKQNEKLPTVSTHK